MLTVNHTPNMAGILVAGDSDDFEALYDALHIIVGREEDAKGLANARNRVLNLCYEVRHARMGNRTIDFKEHGIDPEQMKYMGVIGPAQNLVVAFEILWPEVLFDVFVLNNFISKYEKRQKAHLWDENIATVRLFQGKVLNLASETMTPAQVTAFRKQATGTATNAFNYEKFYAQYIDQLNAEWIELDKEARSQKLSSFAKRASVVLKDYEYFKEYLDDVAKSEGLHPSELAYADEELEIVW